MQLNNFYLVVGFCASIIIATIVTGSVSAQQAGAGQNQQVPIIRQINVIGSERVEPETVASYLTIRTGDPFDLAKINESTKNLFATGLFADVEILEQQGTLIIRVVENPIINRVVFEGNKRLDRDELLEEVRLRPRTIFTRAKVRADVERILALYRNSGRFAAIIEPKVVQLEQNRVDVLFEIQEGPKTRISKINFIGNKKYSDGDLKDVLATKESRWWKIFGSNDTFDPDRQAFDQQVLRQFYLNEGYADFRVVSAVSELTADREDFFVTFTVEEGEIYEFGEISVDSEIRDVDPILFEAFLLMRKGQIYNAEAIEKTIEALTNAAGLLGYAFVDIRPRINRNREGRTIDITFRVLDAPRVYVERIRIHGNVTTLDKVIRREFRLQEGDAFNSALVNRSENRLNRLSFFREIEIEQLPGSTPDRLVLDVGVEEQATGELNLGAGFSSVQNFIFNASVRQRNLFGKGQSLGLSLNLSSFQQNINLDFTEPYLLGRSISGGFNVFVTNTDTNGLGNGIFQNGLQNRALGFQLRAGAALNEFWSLGLRYTIRQDDASFGLQSIGLAGTTIANIAEASLNNPDLLASADLNGDGVITEADFDENGDGSLSVAESEDVLLNFNPFFANSIGSRTQSIIGYTLGTDSRNSIIRPTRGRSIRFNQNFAGLGGSVKYLQTTASIDNYWTPFNGWTLRLGAEGGLIEGINQQVRLNDLFFLGGPRLRGFDNSGVGPREFDIVGQALAPEQQFRVVGGRAFYIGRAELFFPLGNAALESGINASAFFDVGALFRAENSIFPSCPFSLQQFNDFSLLVAEQGISGPAAIQDLASTELGFSGATCISGNSPSPRISVGIGFSWQSPFGPFRIDLARTLRRQLGDDTQTLQFNVGTTF
ncbi:outer membrane protein assembly factor BamA [Kordiimonas sp. SCSIO 12610]|uniref:outer membrane protein assembly factor BamA n=1 Tax=Kordiimonas sp. SCSIO 12610 TaxID=2829597 RepID=UPI00210A3C1E|nr:outer membrane protein assembly factor BamA [Kordiimonas sp. SCSIO 12610]UTW54048.1 outer membrane protein assembly factor BamA [Kordiimonas sp. SCSIO 12610]